MGIKELIKKSRITRPLYNIYKSRKEKRIKESKFKYHGKFINRSNDFEELCIVLAGYKPYLYKYVFERLSKFIPDKIDVCLVTSGMWSDEVDDICRKNKWSYLSTKENHVGLVQNVAIKLHPKAKYIYKLDEDIFITNGYFDKMMSAYEHVTKSKYKAGVIAPIIPINGYGYVRVLEKLDLIDEYNKRFGKVIIAGSESGKARVQIEGSSKIARFFWGEGGIVPHIDIINSLFSSGKTEEYPCPIRFSIGAILFQRELWEDMGFFDVNLKGNSLGRDEVQLCSFCCIHSRPIMVSENVVVGHFSFGSQNEDMKEYFYEHPECFELIK